MSFIICLVVIILFIILALCVQYMVRSTSAYEPTDLVSVAMITSDWHIEPWYSKGGGAQNNWDSNLIDDWSVDATIICDGVVSGSRRGDTPIGMIKSALENFSEGVPKDQRLFFYTGDTFSHDLVGNEPDVAIENTIMYKVFDKDQGLLKYFNPENIFFAIGNHGAKTNEAFWQKDNVSEAWAQSLVNNGIYKPSGPEDIFWQCGYYKKHLPNSTIDIICFNSILYTIVDGHNGCQNCECQEKQINQLKSDLDNLPSDRSVYILTHYPIDSDTAMVKNFIWDKIGTKYQKVINGIFTAHTHEPLASLNQWQSNDGISHTWNIPSIYWRDTDDIASYIKVEFPLNTPLVLSQTDVKGVKCGNMKTSMLNWQ